MESSHHPSLYELSHSKYYKRRHLRSTVLRWASRRGHLLAAGFLLLLVRTHMIKQLPPFIL
jgi:hypothetical protein